MKIKLAFLPVAAVMAVFSIWLSARLITRFGPVTILVVGQLVVAAALAMLGLGPARSVYPVHLLAPLAMLGLGGGLSFPALAILAMSDTRPEDAGLASGLLNTTGQVGGALGLAVLATLAGSRTLNLVQEGAGSADALAGGYHLAWLVGAGAVLVSLAVAIWLLRVRSAEQVEEALSDAEAAA